MKKKRRNPIHAYKHLLAKDYDWDYGYLIALEKKKLQRMHDYFKISDIAEDNKYTTRDLGICLKLIDINSVNLMMETTRWSTMIKNLCRTFLYM